MSKDVLTRLNEFDPAAGREPSEAEWTRSRAQMERIMDEPLQTSDAVRRAPRRAFTLAGAVAAAATVGVVGVVAVATLIPSGGAFASWQPVPTQATAEQSLEQAEDCAQSWEDGPTNAITSSDVFLAERRGEGSLTIMKKGAAVIECIDVDGGPASWMMLTTLDGQPISTSPTGAEVVVDSVGATGEDVNQYTTLVGRVGPDVTGVSVTASDGTAVVASVSSGWFVAWWPGADGADPESRPVTVTAGTTTAEYVLSDLTGW